MLIQEYLYYKWLADSLSDKEKEVFKAMEDIAPMGEQEWFIKLFKKNLYEGIQESEIARS